MFSATTPAASAKATTINAADAKITTTASTDTTAYATSLLLLQFYFFLQFKCSSLHI